MPLHKLTSAQSVKWVQSSAWYNADIALLCHGPDVHENDTVD